MGLPRENVRGGNRLRSCLATLRGDLALGSELAARFDDSSPLLAQMARVWDSYFGARNDECGELIARALQPVRGTGGLTELALTCIDLFRNVTLGRPAPELVARLRAGRFTLLDTQFTTPHLERLGARLVPRSHYHELLERALMRRGDFYSLTSDTSASEVIQLISHRSYRG